MAKTVVITGGSRGIGEALAYEFAGAGFSVIITYRKEAELAQAVLKRSLVLGAPAAHAVELDLMSSASIANSASEILRLCDSVETLINNAGILISGRLSEQTFEEIERQIGVSLLGPMKFTSRLLPRVRGAIINVGSNLARIGKKNLVVYAAAKFGLRGMTRALTKEWPELKVLAVHPGLTATGMGNQGGASPKDVARVIYRFAVGKLFAASGSDIWVADYLPGFWRHPMRVFRRFWQYF